MFQSQEPGEQWCFDFSQLEELLLYLLCSGQAFAFSFLFIFAADREESVSAQSSAVIDTNRH